MRMPMCRFEKLRLLMIFTMFILIACEAYLSPVAALASTEGEKPIFKVEPVFSFDESRPANHSSTIAQMPNGDLLVTWFGGSSEGKPDVALWSARKPAGADAWNKPAPIVDEPQVPEGNSVLFTDSKGTVWLFFVRKYDPKWDAWDKTYLFIQTSNDSGFTWTEPRKITDQMGWMVRNNISEMPDGRLLLPIYHEASPVQCLLWLSGDGFKTWEERRVPVTKPESEQPAYVYMGGEKFLMYARHVSVPGKIWSARSDDLGKTWFDIKKTKMPNPDSGLNAIRLKSGALVLAYNDSGFYRTPLTVALSTDDGKTWPWKKNLETEKKEFSYPFLIQSRDGNIHLVYTADDRRIIKHAEFNEAWLKKN